MARKSIRSLGPKRPPDVQDHPPPLLQNSAISPAQIKNKDITDPAKTKRGNDSHLKA